jgi:hypothetical protein
VGPEEVFHLAEQAVWQMDRWMQTRVRGYKGMERMDRRSCAVLLGRHLLAGNCDCGLDCCPARHNLAAQPGSQVGVPLFVQQAVIGPFDLAANSVAQGMFYRLILLPEEGMLVSNVELKRCTNPRCPRPHREYEEDRCPGHGCASEYKPEETEVIAQERLFVRGVYRTVRRWCCGGSHYYPQRLCRGCRVAPFTEEHYQVMHGPGGRHDHCPWSGCRNGRPQHPQSTGSTLWVRAELADLPGRGPPSADPGDVVSPSDAADPLRRNAIAAGAQSWRETLDATTADTLRIALAAEGSVAPEARDDPLVIADWVLGGRLSGISAAEVERLRQAIRQALRERGLGP